MTSSVLSIVSYFACGLLPSCNSDVNDIYPGTQRLPPELIKTMGEFMDGDRPPHDQYQCPLNIPSFLIPDVNERRQLLYLRLNRRTSKRFLSDEGFRDSVLNRIHQNPSQQLALNLSFEKNITSNEIQVLVSTSFHYVNAVFSCLDFIEGNLADTKDRFDTHLKRDKDPNLVHEEIESNKRTKKCCEAGRHYISCKVCHHGFCHNHYYRHFQRIWKCKECPREFCSPKTRDGRCQKCQHYIPPSHI
eukprot:gene10368-11282_t